MNTTQRLLFPLLLPLAAGCTTEGAVFVTKTSLSFADLDATPPEATLGLHRVEGFIAPRNRNGDTPPVLAHLQSDRGFFQPNVQQVYATGRAAERLADAPLTTEVDCGKGCEGEGRPLTFATSTSIGLRIGLGSTLTSPIEGIMFGFRRKEMSYVPALAKDVKGDYHYPSLIAAIRLSEPESSDKKPDGAQKKVGFKACQGFATGTAATALAARDDAGFGCLAGNETIKQMLTAKHSVELRQQAEITNILRCYHGLPEGDKHGVRVHAAQLGLLAELGPDQSGMVPTVAMSDVRTKEHALAQEDSRYWRRLLHATVPVPEAGVAAPSGATGALVREQLLRLHRGHVCAVMPQK